VYEGRLFGEFRFAGIHPPFSDRPELAISVIKGKPALPVNFAPAFTAKAYTVAEPLHSGVWGRTFGAKFGWVDVSSWDEGIRCIGRFNEKKTQ